MSPAPFATAGDVLGDRYTLRQHAWMSSLGPMWLARDRVLDRTVLIQMLGPKLAADATAARAFQKAAGRIAQITNVGLLQIYDIGDTPSFVAFEYGAGGRLSDRLATGAMTLTETARATLGLARALEAMHERNVAHGAISPACVMLDEEGRAKLLADGTADVARATGASDLVSDQPTSYRPPEASPAPAAADRYALAALAVHMLTGNEPRRGTTLRQFGRSIPSDVDQLLQRALSPDPAARPSMDEFEAVLGRYARVVPRDARTPRMHMSELGWLVPVVIIVALAIGAAILGPGIARDFLGKQERPAPRVTVVQSPGRELTIQSATDFDPQGNESEHPEDVGLAIDGDPGTAWETVGYKDPGVGGKKGVGLILDLGRELTLRRMRVQSTEPGWKAEVRVADALGATSDDFALATTFTAGRDTPVALPRATRGRYLLIWITSLVDDGGGSQFPYRAAIADVMVFAA